MMFNSKWIPRDIIIYIFTYLSSQELVKVSRANSELKKLSEVEILWKEICEQEKLGHLKEEGSSWKETFKLSKIWRWDPRNISVHLSHSENRLLCWREMEGSNPSVKSSTPFSEDRQLFEVTVNTPGQWSSVGISSATFGVDTGYYLGSGIERDIFECTYYSDKFMSDILLMGSKMKDCEMLKENDVISIYVEPYAIYFFRNTDHLVTLKFTDDQLKAFQDGGSRKNLLQLKLFPTVSIGSSGMVTISHKYKKEDLLAPFPSKKQRIEGPGIDCR